MEDIRGLAQPSNSSCVRSYEVINAQHDLDNSMLVTEGTKIMRSHDECDEAGPSGLSSSNDIPHLKRNQYKGRIGHRNSDCMVHSIEGGPRLEVIIFLSITGLIGHYMFVLLCSCVFFPHFFGKYLYFIYFYLNFKNHLFKCIPCYIDPSKP